MRTEEQFKKILAEAKNDPKVLAFWLDGSRGKGIFVTEHSDYDCTMIVKDEALDVYKEKYGKNADPDLELGVKTLPAFKKHAEWQSEFAWDRYNFAHLRPLIDKTGEIQKLFDEKAAIPKDKTREFVSGALGAYLNQVYRSLKCFRDGDMPAARLEVAESVPPLLSALFGIEGRMKPYYKYLIWELKNYPLTALPWTADDFLKKVLHILATADRTTQQEILNGIEPIFRSAGYGEVFDAWKEKFDWMKNYAP